MKTFIIDAFNLMHKNRDLAEKLKISPETASDSLIVLINSFAAIYPTYQFILVFDGNFQNTRQEIQIGKTGKVTIKSQQLLNNSNPRIKIKFSGNESADKIIKIIIEGETNRKNLAVVTSDTEVHNFAKIHSCEVISSEDFNHKIKNPPRKIKHEKSVRTEKPLSSSRNEIDEFKKLFGA